MIIESVDAEVIETVDAVIETVDTACLEPNVDATIETVDATANIESTKAEANIVTAVLEPSVEVEGAQANVDITDVKATAAYLPLKEGEHSLLEKLEIDLEDNVEHFVSEQCSIFLEC